MKVVETTVFSRQIGELIEDDEKQNLLDELIRRPDGGDIIKGSGGLRKMRWQAHGRGKSGGIRVIYYWCVGEIIYLLLAYPKNKKDDLSAKELEILKKVVQEEKKSWKKDSSKT